MDEPRRQHKRRFSWLVSGPVPWAVTTFLVVTLAALFLGMLALLAAVFVLQPHSPIIGANSAKLDTLRYNQLTGTLTMVNVPLNLEARNLYAHSDATFEDTQFRVAFAGTTIAVLRTEPFRLPPKGVRLLEYVVTAQDVVLDQAGRDVMDAAFRDHVVSFEVSGHTKTQWKFLFVPLHQRAHFSCQIRLSGIDGNPLPFSCTSRQNGFFKLE